MGYALCIGICYGCRKQFAFNPVKVPSLTINGTREPFCRDCVEAANPVRVGKGLAPIVPLPDAYEACEEGEL